MSINIIDKQGVDSEKERKTKMNNTSTVETKTVKIDKPEGLHLRVASQVVQICQKHKSKVSLTCGDCPEADGCSILSILMLTAANGDSLTIKAEGADAKEVIGKLSSYFTNGSGI